MLKIDEYTPGSGRMMAEGDTVVNVVDANTESVKTVHNYVTIPVYMAHDEVVAHNSTDKASQYMAEIGAYDPRVTLEILSDKAITAKIQTSWNGQDWFTLMKPDGSGAVSISVGAAAGVSFAFDAPRRFIRCAWSNSSGDNAKINAFLNVSR